MQIDELIKQVESNLYSAFFYTPSIYKKSSSYLLNNPVEIISVYKKNDLEFGLHKADKLIQKGYLGYALLNYEAGYLIEEKLNKLLSDNGKKLMQFFFFKEKDVQVFKSSDIEITLSNKIKNSIGKISYNTSQKQFSENIKKIKNYIREGDTYQVNYTIKGNFNLKGIYSDFFKQLLFKQSAAYSAFINNDENIIISLSPEMFFKMGKKKIISKPMKGTGRRGINFNGDEQMEQDLINKEKNQAENIMIVDLIRNDLGRICKYGSVKLVDKFFVQKYESLFQMVSAIDGKLKSKIMYSDIIKNIFPCGSVTGAPKIRTMQIINDLEKEERGIYTGSIGLFLKNKIEFNVAIRTININTKTNNGEIGVGAGIVWESDPIKEYEETILKSKFLTEPVEYFELFETMLFENGKIVFLEEHLSRLKSAAEFFLFKYSSKQIRKKLEIALKKIKTDKKIIKLALDKWGRAKIKSSDFNSPPKPVKIILSDKKINSENKFQYFKTTNRKLYDQEFRRHSNEGYYDVIFLNENNEITEGSRTNIFIRKGEKWKTPPISSGILNGIYREHLLKSNVNYIESKLKIEDLKTADEITLVNSVRGEVKVDEFSIQNRTLQN